MQALEKRIAWCEKQRTIDNALTILSVSIISALFWQSFTDWFLPLLITGWIVHLGVLLYCHQLWVVRLRKLKSLRHWCLLSSWVTLKVSATCQKLL